MSLFRKSRTPRKRPIVTNSRSEPEFFVFAANHIRVWTTRDPELRSKLAAFTSVDSNARDMLISIDGRRGALYVVFIDRFIATIMRPRRSDWEEMFPRLRNRGT